MSNKIQIKRVKNLSAEDFSGLAKLYQPLIIENAIEDWKALTRWSPDYLRQSLGNFQVKFKQSDTHVHPNMRSHYNVKEPASIWSHLFKSRGQNSSKEVAPFKSTNLGEYLDLISDPVKGAHYYLTGDELLVFDEGQWSPNLEVLRDDFRVPGYFEEKSMNSAGLWFSAKGVRSHLHFDGGGSHNLNAQITGKKYVQMYSPFQMSCLYPYYCTYSSKKGPYHFSEIDVENFDINKFPRFQDAKCYEGEIGEGDMLFIPAYWYHSFKHLGKFNSNINFWWIPDSIPLSPVSVRDTLMRATQQLLPKSKEAPFGLLKWANRLEEKIIHEAFEGSAGKLSRTGVRL
ncbi:cupin-like domain-containing protein [Mycoavidus sp. SF9855]|uniref:cupin-like domain-containing protein n=1 Tax=Mycoavidus sp. SF9855 TaxID=2968475 RepID=UPI00211CE4B4|nr:cupin-like domain-containing protein [Mycoavidus sp. SF9855]UUM20789.1 cupin-like domain-containing protein [Mycoavidus sp. SF9855]